MRTFNKKQNKKKSQQLVEFLLVAPFVIIILGILLEYAYALSVNMNLNQGLKYVASSVYGEIKPNTTSAALRTAVENQLKTYLESSKVSVSLPNNFKVDYVTVGDSAVFLASYTYVSAFTLPKVYFHFLPETFNFTAVTMVPSAFLKKNDYPEIYSTDLDKIWASSPDFSNETSFNSSKNGIMNEAAGALNPLTSSIMFLVPKTPIAPVAPAAKFYQIFQWSGPKTDVASGNPFYSDVSTGTVYTCTPTLCSPIMANLIQILGPNVTSVIFYEDYDPLPWATSAGQIALAGENGRLKKALALMNSGTSQNGGNYDNLPVLSYNDAVSSVTKYKVDTKGSLVIAHPSTVNAAIAGMTSLIPAPNIDYNFGTRVNP